MKKIAFLSALVFCCTAVSAQQAPPAVAFPAPNTEDVRIKSLEDQVRTLAEEVALLRGELKAMREAKFPQPGAADRILLASSHIEPGIVLAPTSAPAGSPAPLEPLPAQISLVLPLRTSESPFCAGGRCGLKHLRSSSVSCSTPGALAPKWVLLSHSIFTYPAPSAPLAGTSRFRFMVQQR